MPNFPRPTPTQMPTFAVRCTVTDGAPPTVAIEYSLYLADANSVPTGSMGGDLTPYLTPAQVSAFTAAALALQVKAKAELLS